MKQYRIQFTRNEAIPLSDSDRLPRVNYEELLDQLHFPIIWVYEHYLQAWIPSEATHDLIAQLNSPSPLWNRRLAVANLIEPEGRIYWEDLQATYKKEGFVIIPQLISEAFAREQLTPYYYRNSHLHKRHPDMEGIKRSSVNNMPWMRLLHQATQKLVNYIVQPDEIKTSYSFTSSYDAGSSLPRHTDRPQCIYNISLMLGSSPFGANLHKWPLFIERNEVTQEIKLGPGDGVLYLGRRDPHWRDKMPKNLESVLGVFFHYVDKDFSGSLD